MKKILIITLFCLVLLSGCKKEEVKPNKTTEPEKKYLTKMEMNIKLTEYGKEIYKNEKYKIVEKKDGIYFLSLNTLKEKLGYDISNIENVFSRIIGSDSFPTSDMIIDLKKEINTFFIEGECIDIIYTNNTVKDN